MRGMGQMLIAGMTIMASMTCQGCLHNGGVLDANMPSRVDYTATRMLDMPEAVPLTSTYQSSLEVGERAPGLSFAQTAFVSSKPLNLSLNNPSSDLATRLSDSAPLMAIAAERENQRLLFAAPKDTQRVTAELTLSAPSARTGLGFDVGIAPRLEVLRDGDYEAHRFGGELRIGQNFDKRGEGDSIDSWYLFAGADGEALVWEPDEDGRVGLNDMSLRDKVTVGDMQAGVSFQSGEGQLSFSYISREVEYRERNLGASDTEDFLGLSFTMRR